MLYRGKRVRERGRLPKGKFPKKGGRRLVSGLLALVLCLTLVPVIYADTVVTVTSWYAAGAFEENTLYWVDNNNEDGVRPGANTYQPSLWFRIDNGEWIELKGGEDSTLSGVGLSAMPKMTVADNGNNTYTVSVPTGVLPEAIETTTSDGYGGETSTESRVEWIMGPSEGVDGYSPVEVNNGNVSEYPSAGDNYGWYYVLEDEFNFRVQLRWGNLGGAEGIAEAIYNSFDFVVDTNYTASSLRRLLAEMKDQMKIEEDPDGDPDNPTSGTVTVSGLWKYNLDGSRINYSVEETREGDGKGDGRLDAADGIAAGALPEGDYFQISYDNSSTPNVGTEVGKLYDGGSLYLTLTGVKDYQASKVWEDAADPDHRPAGELQLWRYRAGQSYTTAAPVRDDGGSILTVPLNGQEKQDIQFAELPKYDSEGYEYIYVVREYLTGEHAGDYTQVFGAVGEDGGVTDIIWALDEDSGTLKKLTSEDADFARETNNTYLYNGGTLSNKLSGTVTVNATKIWKAAAFQSALEDVRVELMLQARPVGSEDPWEDTEITETLGTEKTGKFTAENLGGLSVSASAPKYDNQGRELEYRWVESAVYQGENKTNLLDNNSFTLSGGGSRGDAKYRVTDVENGNTTEITNAVRNQIDYTVEKKWKSGAQEGPVTFALYRTIGEQSLTETCKVLTFTMDAGGTVNVDFTKENAFIDAIDGEISIQFSEAWKALLQNLPEYDEEGRRYEYLILEENGNPTYETSIDSSTGDYTTIVTNGPGGSHRILVQKNWVDDSDAAHREPVEVTVYSKEGDQAITFVTLGESQEDGDPIWYAWAGIGELTPDQVYIRETKIGATAVLGTEGAPTEGEINAPGITRDTVPGRNHAYEATYDREEIAGETVCTVTNRRLGNVDLTVTKDWRDGGGDGVGELQAALENTSGLTLAVKLKIAASDDTEGQFKIYQKDGFGYVNLGGGDVQIQDRSERRVSSIQPILTADTKSNSLDFWNLPKYDTNGTVVRYTVEEVWLDGGNEITLDQLRTISPEVYALWNTYTSSIKEESYTANDGENKNDEQKITLTNKRTGVTDAVWYKQWYDIYMYGSGSRPDIYLDIYRTVHTSAAEDGIETELIYPSYRWTNEGLLPPETEAPSEGAGDPAGEEPGTASGDNGSADRQYFWRAELENLPKYDDWGYKITYSAVERTSVNASDFDYAIAEYWTGETCLGTRDEADPGMEAAYEAQTTNLDGVNPPVSQDASSSYAKYALNANGTFVNRLNKPVAIEGRKLWTNLPAGYPAVDLPNVAFALYRRVQGSGEAFDFGGAPIATLTVQDWSGLKNYTFRLLYEGKNIIDDGAGTVRPESEDQPGLPKYTEEGKLYEYVLREEGITGANGLPLDGTGEGPQESLDLFDIQEISNTFQVENVFHSPTGSLSVKKILELPLGGDDLPIAYPAVRFHLYRVYIQNNGQPSAQELVRTATWSSEEVEAAYQQRGDSTTVETVLSFTGLEQYAPNGSLYLYHVEEDKSFLGGYDTWCGPGDLEAQDVTGDGYTVGGLLPHEEREEADATFLNSRKAVQTEFVTLTGQKAWEDFYDAFGLRPDAPYEEGKDGTLVPVIRLTVTRRAAAQEGQGDPHIEEKLTEGEDYTVKWTQDAETGKWTYQIWGADDPDAEEPGISAEEPAEPGPGQGEETTPPTEMPPEEGNQPADPPTDEGDTQSPEPPADGEEDQNPDSQAGDGDGQSAPQEETLSAASLHSDPADGEHGGAGSVPVTPTEPAEDPDQIGDPDSQDPSEETPPAAQPQTELEKWAPNGARWVYTVKEELNSDLKEALYERYQYYFTGNGTAGEDSADGDTIHMKELKNSLETRAPFTKRWVGSDGEPITADYMDLGEMSVTFELYVKEGKSGGWQRAADYFTQENLGEDAYEKLKDAGILNGFSITLENRHIYDSWSGACENLPRVVKKDSGISELSYRVVETEIAYQGGAATITVDTCGEEFAYTVADSGGLFTGIEDTYTESGNSTTITNKLATTSLQVQKIWTNDRNNVYGTRPDTDEAGKTWETSFLIQRTTDLSVGWEAAAWEAVQVTGENGQKQDLVVTLTGTDTEGTVESPVGMTISGLPKQNAEGEYTYRAVELEPGYQMTNGAVDLSSYVLLRDSYNEAYTAAYTYGGQSDDGFLTTAANDMQTTKVFAGKTWMPAGEEGAQVTLHLQYAVPLENPAEGPAYTWKTLTAVSVTLDGTTDPDLDKPYYEYAEWKAVWENLPARMPGSYLPDSDSETEYRVTEAVSGSYVQVGDTKKENKTDVDGTYPEFQFTNKAVTSLTVEKKWHTADTKKHPITMELWRTTDKNLMGKTGVDGVEQVAGMTAELSAANNWRHIFGELDKVNSQNQKYYYYAIEQGTPDEDMEVIYDHGEPTETTVAFTTAITNRGYTDIPVSKTWRDDSDAQGLRPETLKLTLYRRTDPAAQGEVAGEVTLSAKNAQDGNADVWTYTFEHLPDTDGSGNPYTYWVEEEHLESYTVTGSGTLALTNTLGGKETEIAIQGRKTWVGDGADDRPNSITLSLLQNGTKVAEREVTPNADGSWTYDFGSWPAYDDSGRAYTYTVQEEPVDGYGTRVDGWNVINGKGNLTVKKQVYSGDRQRDFSFTVTLDDKSINGICGDMTFQDGVAAFTLKDGESKTAKGLPSGVGYTVAEARVDGYGTRVEGHNPGMVPFGDTAEVLIINYDDTTPPPDPDPDPDPKPDPDPGPDPMPDPDPHPTPDPDESPDPDMPDTPDEPGHPDEPDDSVPTGDTAQLALYLALLAASLAGAAAIVILGRKGRKRD